MSLSDFFAAVTHGAGLIYHDVVAAEAVVTKWTEAHPEVRPLLHEALVAANTVLASAGVPVPAVQTVIDGVLSVLKQMAARDATVQSGGQMGIAATAPAA